VFGSAAPRAETPSDLYNYDKEEDEDSHSDDSADGVLASGGAHPPRGYSARRAEPNDSSDDGFDDLGPFGEERHERSKAVGRPWALSSSGGPARRGAHAGDPYGDEEDEEEDEDVAGGDDFDDDDSFNGQRPAPYVARHEWDRPDISEEDKEKGTAESRTVRDAGGRACNGLPMAHDAYQDEGDAAPPPRSKLMTRIFGGAGIRGRERRELALSHPVQSAADASPSRGAGQRRTGGEERKMDSAPFSGPGAMAEDEVTRKLQELDAEISRFKQENASLVKLKAQHREGKRVAGE
jgi:hypothetical protein